MPQKTIENFKHRIEIGHYSLTENDSGKCIKQFKTYGECWADIKERSLIDCLPFGESNKNRESSKRGLNVTIRRIPELERKAKKINAIKVNKQLFTNNQGFFPRLGTQFFNGIFCECG